MRAQLSGVLRLDPALFKAWTCAKEIGANDCDEAMTQEERGQEGPGSST